MVLVFKHLLRFIRGIPKSMKVELQRDYPFYIYIIDRIIVVPFYPVQFL
jgi:hypothetical protein